jgi:hypothetical protein
MVFGTDGDVLPHGQGVDEMVTLVETGLSPLEVIRSATINAAKALGIADSVGDDRGRRVRGPRRRPRRPLQTVSALKAPAFVALRGRVVLGPSGVNR